MKNQMKFFNKNDFELTKSKLIISGTLAFLSGNFNAAATLLGAAATENIFELNNQMKK